MQNDTLNLGGREFSSRFILGSGKYSHELIDAAIKEAGAQMITLALRRVNESRERNILEFIPKSVALLSLGYRASLVAEILLKSRLSQTANIYFPITPKR